MSLHIADGLSLPLDFVTKTCAIFAQRRKGKTYTASVIAEELVAAGQPFVALDPTGAWWGLRAAADGIGAGLPVIVLGGQHGDLPLERNTGRIVADLVLEQKGFYVLDFSLFESRAAEREFAYAFGDRLYRHKMRPGMDFPLHLFVDEADLFVPQEREQGDNLMLGAYQSIVRRGGLHGLGTTLISQRPALISKNVLTQLDMLILLRLVAGNDQDYLDKNYIKRAASVEQRAELMDSLAQLALGEAWVWEPGADPLLFERVRMRQRHTFNSSATPRAGETRIEPRTLADVDVTALKDALAETIEKAKNDDPVLLRQQIAALKRDVAAAAAHVCPVPAPVEPEILEVPMLDDTLATRLEETLASLRIVYADGVTVAQDTLDQLARARATEPTPTTGRAEVGPPRGAVATVPPAVQTPARQKPAPPSPTAAAAETGDEVKLGKTERNILTVLATYGPRTLRQLALQSGYSAKASTIGVAAGKLRKVGYLEPSTPFTITAAGLEWLGDYDPLPTGPALLEHWRAQFGLTETRILDALIQAYPNELRTPEIAERTGYSPVASTIGVSLSKLRKVEIVEGFRVSDQFMEAIRG